MTALFVRTLGTAKVLRTRRRHCIINDDQATLVQSVAPKRGSIAAAVFAARLRQHPGV
jgi:hypothetical protein